MNRSMRLRLLVATSISSVVVLSLFGGFVYLAMWKRLLSDYDASLMAKARAIAATAEQRDGRVKFELDWKQMPEFSAGTSPEYFQGWLDDGQVLIRSESLRGNDLPKAAAAGELLPGMRDGRSKALSFTPRPSRSNKGSLRTCTIAVAGRPLEAERTLQNLGALLLGSCGAAIVLSGIVLLRVVGRAVRPVKALSQGIERIQETDLAYRLSSEGVPLELVPVVEKLNGLLSRLEKAFAREQAFTADVAHELRTPLTGLLTTLEVCRSQRRQPAAYEAVVDECRGMTERMQVMVENLLILVRADAGQLRVERQKIDVALLLGEIWLLFEDSARTRHLQLQWDATGECTIETDPDKFRIIIQNVLNNAVSYTEEGGMVRIATSAQDGGLLIEVANTGSSVAAEDLPHVFERFWMGDRDRSETGVHCGLGLSLTQRLMTLLGGRIRINSTAGGEFVVQLWLPFVQSSLSGNGRAEPSPAAMASV